MAEWTDIKQSVVDELVVAGEKVTVNQIEGRLSRVGNQALSDIDYIIDWDIAIFDYSKTIAEGHDNVSVGQYTFFKPIVCIATVSSVDYPLTFIHLTDLKILSTAIDTFIYPEKYSLAGNKIYIGPGLASADITVKGSARRRLTISDIPYLPDSLVINRMLMRLLKPGTPAHIAAWSGWKEDVRMVKQGHKITAERRSNMVVDGRVASFNAEMNALD
jgi:hypothetical protein